MVRDISSRCRYLVWRGWRKIRHRPVLAILLALIMVYFIAAIVVMVYEKVGFAEAALRVFPSFFGEVGEMPGSMAVQISIVVGILTSIIFLVIIIARVTSGFLEFLMRGGSMAKKVNFSGHTIICGWNFQGERVVKELLSANVKKRREIVILTDNDDRPVKDERVQFIKGDPSQDENLKNAGVERADSIIVLTDFDKEMNAADAEALMIVLAVESLSRKAHTCVQIRNSDNHAHLEHAHADEIICLDQTGGNIAVASALNHGVSRVLCELLTFDEGSEFYRYDKPLSKTLVGKEFTEAVGELAKKHIILLGIETGIETDHYEEFKKQMSADVLIELSNDKDDKEPKRVMVVNPQSDYIIRQGDALFVIAKSEPTML
jgi:voltage-gated potassium channel